MVEFLLFMALAVFLPTRAHANGGLTEFSGPLTKIMNTFTGPTGLVLSTVALLAVGLSMYFGQKSLDGSIKEFMNVAVVICFVAFAGSVVGNLFTFSGAIV